MKKSANILVVDDNADLADTFALILKRKGYMVDTAGDGIQALEKFKGRHFDAVLMDVIMPRMDGIEALHKMREIDTQSKIILMTAYCEEEKLDNVTNEGAYSTLNKPVNVMKLMELIGEVTSNPSILIVDDDDDFRYSLSRLLELQNFAVTAAVDGKDALRIAERRKFNLALVDVKMAIMDGVTTSFKLMEIDPEMPIVMMTGYHNEVKEMVEEAIGKGVIKCLNKPLDMADFTQLVSQAI